MRKVIYRLSWMFIVIFATANTAGSEPSLVNLGRLSITHITASGTNGNRDIGNPYHGAINLFDDGGQERINNLIYTTWLTDRATRHWVKLKFTKPVGVHSVFVETTAQSSSTRAYVTPPTQYAMELVQTDKDKQQVVSSIDSVAIVGFRSTYNLPKPLNNVSEITVIFPGSDIIEVSEIRVMGTAPKGTDLTPTKPNIGFDPGSYEYGYSSSIKLTVKDENELHIIRCAENALPSIAEVQSAATKAGNDSQIIESPDNLWWYSKLNGIQIPFAITGKAVQYYENLVNTYAKQNSTNTNKTGSHLTYTASVQSVEKTNKQDDSAQASPPSTDFEDIYIVTMQLKFSICLGDGNGISFSKERKVTLNPDGKVLKVTGDAPTTTAIE